MTDFAPHGPTRIKPWEVNGGKVVINPNLVCLNEDKDWRPKQYTSYLWVLKDEDTLYVGIETQVEREHLSDSAPSHHQGYGHPTLTGGVKALYGGELLYKPQEGGWIINGASGRYGRSDVPVINGTRLRQAQRMFSQLIGLNVKVSDYEVKHG